MIGRDGHRAMPHELDPRADPGRSMDYQIRIAGQLGPRWEDWFEGLTVTLDGDDTLMTGPVVDQAALHGLLRRVRDLGLPLISVGPVEQAPSSASGTRPADPSGVTSSDSAGGASASTPAGDR